MKKVILLDGAMGTTLNKRGLHTGYFPEAVNITAPSDVTDVHRLYVEAGSGMIYTCSFGVNRLKAAKSKYTVPEVIKAAVSNARAACGLNTRVALDTGTLGELLEPFGDISEEKVRAVFTEIAEAGKEADLTVLETLSDLREAIIALETVKKVSSKPVFVTMTFGVSGRTLMGNTPAEIVRELTSAGADAVGLNCSLGPKEAFPIIRKIRDLSTLPVVVKPNAGMPDPKTGKYRLSPEDFAELMMPIIELGVDYAGGCCGTDPEYISALSKLLI